MFDSTTLAITIFIVAYALIISEKVHRTIVGIFGAMLMIMFGILSQETACLISWLFGRLRRLRPSL